MIKIAVCGRSASGKDYVCRQLSKMTRLRYSTSTSRAMSEIVYSAASVSPELATKYADAQQCFDDRGHYRKFWSSVIASYNCLERTKLYSEILAKNDLLNGIWTAEDLRECTRTGLIDMSIWIERTGLPDPAIDFGPELCDIAIHHSGDLEELDTKVCRLSYVLI